VLEENLGKKDAEYNAYSSPWGKVLLESRSYGQDISRLLWNPKFRYRVHKTPPLVSVLGKLNLILTHYSCNINLSLSSHLRSGLSSCLIIFQVSPL